MDKPPRVHVVEDDNVVRESLCLALASGGIDVICHAGIGGLLTTLKSTPDKDGASCVLLDIRLPRHMGLAVLAMLHEQYALLPVIVLSAHGDIPMAVTAMKLGAADLLDEPFDRRQLLDRVQAVLRSSMTHPRRENTEDPAVRRQRSLWATLTPREREVFDAIVKGASNKRCAADLQISVRTVETHRARIMKKLQARSVVDLVQFGLVFNRSSMTARQSRYG